jgi:hypothetical protein
VSARSVLPTDVLVTAVLSRVLLPRWAGLAEPFDRRLGCRVQWAPKLSRQLGTPESYSWVAKCYLLCCPMAGPPSGTPEMPYSLYLRRLGCRWR